MIRGNKECTGVLISLGGGAAISKVKTKWPGINVVHYISAQMTASQPFTRNSYEASEVAITSPWVSALSSQPTSPKVANRFSKIAALLAALPSQPVDPEETTASSMAPILSSQATPGTTANTVSVPRWSCLPNQGTTSSSSQTQRRSWCLNTLGLTTGAHQRKHRRKLAAVMTTNAKTLSYSWKLRARVRATQRESSPGITAAYEREYPTMPPRVLHHRLSRLPR
jgi:hypothetical protein